MKALKELGIRQRGGFDDYAQALLDGTFSKLIQVQLVRNVDGATFYQVQPVAAGSAAASSTPHISWPCSFTSVSSTPLARSALDLL